MEQANLNPISLHDDLEEAYRVLRLEAEALLTLAQGLDESFQKALNIVMETEGRVILAGIGKSGHVAHKIAATFSSTGTPAFFIHPSEASHGD
ncbi:MAG: SIS domain-containing protein, partial [Alphaproteobacteria bacterium]|nr:SIS domain-containing protein [Alphaproteobacteria bacterium]